MWFLIFLSCSEKKENIIKKNDYKIKKWYLPLEKGEPNIEKYETLLGEWDVRRIMIKKHVKGQRSTISKDTVIRINISKEGIFDSSGIKIGENYGDNSTVFSLKLDTLECRYYVMGKNIDKRGAFIFQSPGVKYYKNEEEVVSLTSTLYLTKSLK
ncbi:hypothetical protein [Apibacter adventoris]|nr:hypothetical protein [Apibacter adventoris]